MRVPKVTLSSCRLGSSFLAVWNAWSARGTWWERGAGAIVSRARRCPEARREERTLYLAVGNARLEPTVENDGVHPPLLPEKRPQAFGVPELVARAIRAHHDAVRVRIRRVRGALLHGAQHMGRRAHLMRGGHQRSFEVIRGNHVAQQHMGRRAHLSRGDERREQSVTCTCAEP